MNYSCGYCNI